MATYLTPVLTPVGEAGGHRGPGPISRVANALEESRLRRKRVSIDLHVVRSHQSHVVKILSYEEAVAKRAARRPPRGDDAA